MELSEQAKLDIKNALNGKISENCDALEVLLINLTAAKAEASDHGKFKRIDNAVVKVQSRINRLKA